MSAKLKEIALVGSAIAGAKDRCAAFPVQELATDSSSAVPVDARAAVVRGVSSRCRLGFHVSVRNQHEHLLIATRGDFSSPSEPKRPAAGQ
jgi:hypothetical protein